MDQPGGEVGVHRLQREEAVRDGAEGLPQPVGVGEARRRRSAPAARRARARRRTPRSPPTAACRARSAAALTAPPFDLVVAFAEPCSETDSASCSSWPGRSRQSTVTSQRPGITFRFCDASIIVGATVSPSSGSTISAATGSICTSGRERTGGRRHAVRYRREKPFRLGGQLRLGRELAEPLDQARRLDQRVVGDPRHRPVAAATADVQDEGRAALLGRRAQVEHATADLDAVACRPR